MSRNNLENYPGTKVLFRYDLHWEQTEITLINIHMHGVRPKLLTFPVLRSTPKGYWIEDQYFEERWVSAHHIKRYAYQTPEQALTNFIKRKTRYLSILKNNTEITQQVLGMAIALREAADA